MGGIDHVATMPSIHAWTPCAPGGVYLPFSAVLPSGPQMDPSVPVTAPVPGHSAAIFAGMPGSGFQTTIQSVGV
ncbi:unnamed protein product [Ilex paraguariensis]|uniref:Uncharacterized protein n=1 Tax=Ilex paraguariensis TaxID=185542 RepID=A0ABC8TXD1_9AQUA